MQSIIITGGGKYSDIDVLACAIALAEVKNFEAKKKNLDQEFLAVLADPFNGTVPKKFQQNFSKYLWDGRDQFEGSKFIIVDTSLPDYFIGFVRIDDVVEIVDHHPGAEEFWKEKLGEKSWIEEIGACATQVFEYAEKIAKDFSVEATEVLSKESFELLYTAIFSNTLNFNAGITTDRDKEAFEKIKNLMELPQDFIEKYYAEIEEVAFSNPESTLENDRKLLPLNNIEYSVGQLELWDSKEFIEKNREVIYKIIKTEGRWFLSSPCISEGINYIVTDDEDTKKLLSEKIDAEFDGDLGKSKRLWLRKEIMKKFN